MYLYEIKLEDLPERMTKMISSLSEVEKQHIIKISTLNRMNILATSKMLGIHRDTLKRKLTEYGYRKNI
jgi:transcriptional regulator of acetoin/glycerol metabolism